MRGSWKTGVAMLFAGVLIVSALVSGSLVAADGKPPVMVFTNDGPQGKIWVNVDLTRQRLDQPYVPMIVAILNNAAKPIMLDRSSFHLIGPDGRKAPMATIQEIRKNYKKLNFDWRTFNAQGMPFGTRLSPEYYVQSRFFPSMTDGGSIKVDRLQIPPSYWTVDLLYFERPSGLAEGRPVVLEAAPRGWEKPILVTIQL